MTEFETALIEETKATRKAVEVLLKKIESNESDYCDKRTAARILDVDTKLLLFVDKEVERQGLGTFRIYRNGSKHPTYKKSDCYRVAGLIDQGLISLKKSR